MNSGVHKYRLGPFLLRSEVPIPELEPYPWTSAVGGIEVSVRVATVPEQLDDAVANESRWWATRDEYLLRVPGVAGFHVRCGREILVEPAPGAPPGDVRAYLLAPIFAVLCYQAGFYSLHASAVCAGDGVVAFLGDSGAGKSTLAACLERRGYPVLSDDICLLMPQGSAGLNEGGGGLDAAGVDLQVAPIAPALKLWRSALEHLGDPLERLPRVVSRKEKYRVKVGPSDQVELRLPLHGVYFLNWVDSAERDAPPATFTRVQGAAAVARLMEFNHFDYLMKATGRQRENFLLCSRIVSRVPAFFVRRPKDFSVLDAGVEALEAHFNTRLRRSCQQTTNAA